MEKLVITPLEIDVNIPKDESLEFPKEGEVSYNTVRLVVGDKEIKGDYYLKGVDPKNYQHMYLFQSPEWYKDWSQVPIKLILKDAFVRKYDPSKNWITLSQPVEKKQSTQLTVEDYNVHFTYYTDGKDLIVESESDSLQGSRA
ncbi:hypothetical protein [Paenibacillus glacialis]|uniref:hypothetical protein n=1 Tax=Paenibacillus glacialis TaxID=494026 RepID=UPI000AB83463|nr:hypothetical protein [Paenibacillus glacialis]